MDRVPDNLKSEDFGCVGLLSRDDGCGMFVSGAEYQEKMSDYSLSGFWYPAFSAGGGDLLHCILSCNKSVGRGVPTGNGIS